MDQQTYDDQIFEYLDYTAKTVKGREFQSCTFRKCNFTEAELSGNKFLECTFDNCNLSMAKFRASTFSNAVFKDCKILGVNFYECQDFLFSVSFNNCIIDYSSFMRKKMVKTRFIRSSLKDVNFNQTNLSGSVFDQIYLSGTVFNGTDLSTVNFVTAYNYSIDPELNNIRKASFASDGLSGLLDKYGIKII